MNIFVNLERFVEKVHASEARGNHKLPLHFLGLNLVCTLKVDDSLLKLILLSMVHTQARDHIDLSWVVSERLLIEMNGLIFILLLLV